jgi:hypothetical protein
MRRLISMNFKRGTPTYDLNETFSKTPNHFSSLRNRLLIWRIAQVVTRGNFNSIDPNTIRPFGQPLGELKDKWSPLLKMIYLVEQQQSASPSRAYQSVGNALAKDFKTVYANKADTWEGRVVAAIKARGRVVNDPIPIIVIEFSTLWEELANGEGVQKRGDDGNGNYTRLIAIDQPDASKKLISEILRRKLNGERKHGAEELAYKFLKADFDQAAALYLVWQKIGDMN